MPNRYDYNAVNNGYNATLEGLRSRNAVDVIIKALLIINSSPEDKMTGELANAVRESHRPDILSAITNMQILARTRLNDNSRQILKSLLPYFHPDTLGRYIPEILPYSDDIRDATISLTAAFRGGLDANGVTVFNILKATINAIVINGEAAYLLTGQVPVAAPAPKAAPAPGPVPKAAPAPGPVPKAAPAPGPVPKAAPAPGPVPKAAPAPGPVPKAAPAPGPVPKAAPGPGPVPKAAPAPGPVPKAAPAPGPAPAPEVIFRNRMAAAPNQGERINILREFHRNNGQLPADIQNAHAPDIIATGDSNFAKTVLTDPSAIQKFRQWANSTR